MTARVEHVVTSGVFSLDGQDFDVDNNVWLVGDDTEVLVIDAAHDAEAIITAVGGRRVVALVCTHGHNDHVNVAGDLSGAWQLSPRLHPGDDVLWQLTNPALAWSGLDDGEVISVAGVDLCALLTPGHSPGSMCLYAEQLGIVFTGDTLFAGGPGATGRSYSDFPTIIDSIRSRLLILPAQTSVRPGHGATTTIGAEAPDVEEWLRRGS